MQLKTWLGLLLSSCALFTAEALSDIKQVGTLGKGRFTARLKGMPDSVQGAGQTVEACRKIAQQYHDKILDEFGEGARTGDALTVAALWDKKAKEFFISSVPHEANFIPDAEKAGQRWLEVYKSLPGGISVTPHAEDGAYSLWEKIYNASKDFSFRLVNGKYPEGVLVIGAYGSDTSSSYADLRNGKALPLCSGQGLKGRIDPSCQAIARQLPVTFQDESCSRKRHYTIRGRVVDGACELRRPTASSRHPSAKTTLPHSTNKSVHPSTKATAHHSVKVVVTKAAATATAHSGARPTKASSKKATKHTLTAGAHRSKKPAAQ